MDPRVKNTVIEYVTFKFNPDGSIQANNKIPAIKDVRDLLGVSVAEAKMTVEQAIVELVALGFGEFIARVSFSAGEISGRRSEPKPALGEIKAGVPEARAAAMPNVSANKGLTPRRLNEMNRVELIRYARSLGVNFQDVRRKNIDELIAMILGAQSNYMFGTDPARDDAIRAKVLDAGPNPWGRDASLGQLRAKLTGVDNDEPF